MMRSLDRRNFLATSAALSAGVLTAGRLSAADAPRSLKKALIGKPVEETLVKWKAAGFDGIESTERAASPEQAEAARKVAEGLGMRVHAVLYGWANFNKPEAVEADLAGVEVALRACKGYGADALLLVPCRIGGMKIPEAWEFDIEFDEKTGKLKRVVKGDNAPYADYIAAHDHAVEASRQAVTKLIPVAEKLGVVIALENVWNNLWVQPEIFANFVKSFDSPWVQTYYDIGNHVKYAAPQRWIRALGKTIVKVHVKDFKLNDDGRGGKFVNIRDGSVDWPATMAELDKIGYRGWMTIEGGDVSVEEHSQRLDKIIAGQ